MREIKFRAWDGEAMYSQEDIGDDYDFVIGGECWLALTVNQQFHECGSGVAEEYWQYVTVDAEFMQFTGLTDKNGVDIYEGDILSDHIGKGVVEYKERYAAFRIKYGKPNVGRGKWFLDYNLRGERESLEVIGNIHQNSELLK